MCEWKTKQGDSEDAKGESPRSPQGTERSLRERAPLGLILGSRHDDLFDIKWAIPPFQLGLIAGLLLFCVTPRIWSSMHCDGILLDGLAV
jgi:hypothetical protein